MIDTGYLIRCRIDKGISQHKLARKIGAGQASVCSWEAGRNEPDTIERLVKWIRFVGADPKKAIKWKHNQ